MSLGKEIRLSRLLSDKGRMLVITVDHAMARGVLPGLERIADTVRALGEARPDGLTMHKGIAERCFSAVVGQTSLIMKCSTFAPYHFTYDSWVTDVEEAVRFGADAVSMGVLVGGPYQADMVRNLGLISKASFAAGMPLIAHIYPRGGEIKDECAWENVRYAVRVGAELGVDVVKTTFTGDTRSFAKVVEASPVPVVIAGGASGSDRRSYLLAVRQALDAGAAGVTFGRPVWGDPHPKAMVEALRVLIHRDQGVDIAEEVYNSEVEREDRP